LVSKTGAIEKNVDTIPLLFQQIVNDPYTDNIELAAGNWFRWDPANAKSQKVSLTSNICSIHLRPETTKGKIQLRILPLDGCRWGFF
jgi:hypothetical protein